ncbi:MAG: AAA family ATPase, partial [Gemmatimonadetes bacterium]|nr:AAA family ATPase [Gemmatimonadota bacterium]
MVAFPTLIGRQPELRTLFAALDAAEAKQGSTLFLVGEGGVGKTRLAATISDEAARRGWRVATGRAYPTESGVPYAPFADALLPLLRALNPAEAAVLSRGDAGDLASLFPVLAAPAGPYRESGDPAELKTRLLWNLTQFASRIASRRPLLLVLDNLQWADPSSLELLHFMARQIEGEPIVLLGTTNDAARYQNRGVEMVERSLVAAGVATTLRLEPLSPEDTRVLVRVGFDAEDREIEGFSTLLYDRTRGNPFFVEEALKALVHSGRLYRDDGRWRGWDVDAVELPHSIRETLLARVERLSAAARPVADLAAIIGTRVSYGLLRAAVSLSESDLVDALDELCAQRVLLEAVEADTVVYDFTHPLLRDTLCAEVGAARSRLLHARIAEALEVVHGDRAREHAGELAFHYARAHPGGRSPKAALYLALAGRNALGRYANREAADYLTAALEQGDSLPDEDRLAAQENLARARQRMGENDEALALWEQVAAAAGEAGQHARVAAIRRHMGLACFWNGRYARALELYAQGLDVARRAGHPVLEAGLRLARGVCLQEIGRVAEARDEVQAALVIAEGLGNEALLARVHRALLVVYAWTGPFDQAREHGAQAVALAERVGDRGVACSAHWTLGMLEGLTGGADAAAHHMDESERLARELGSPVLRLWTAEMQIELASATGDWDEGIRLADQMIELARNLGQQTFLPRLLVWSGLIHLNRGDLERGKAAVDEAWELAGDDVHARVLAHTGLAAYHSACGDHIEARRVGEAGLAIADQTGFVIWAIHRLIPVVAESYLWLLDLDGAEALGRRLRTAADRFGHRLARAWADTCEGMVLHLRGELEEAAVLMQAAITELEQIP